MRKPYHPDDSGMTWQNGGGRNNRNGGGGGNGYGGGFNIIRPVETRTLAQDMADEFGGSVGGWRRNINERAPTFNFGGGHGRGNRKGGNPGGGGDLTGGFDPSSPRNRTVPIAMQMQAPPPMQFRQPMPPTMAMQIPQQGLLGNPMLSQQPQQQGLLGDVPPEVMAFIRSGGMR